ncbi:MAG: MOSC domain-containing protein [Clostridia bacterium]
MKIVSINISEKRGTIKKPVMSARLIENFGIEGDAHAANDYHRQVSLLSVESVDTMKEALPSLSNGSFAENITTSGLTLYTLPIGTLLTLGQGCVLEVTQIGKTCHDGCEIKKLVGRCVMPTEGIFARVLKGGTIEVGDEIGVTYPVHE